MISVKKLRLIVACISLLVCMTFIEDTYAKYVNGVDAVAQAGIARWKILVNNADIESGSLAAQTITPVFAGNTNIAANVIAPTSTGYYDIVIDSSNTDVSFDYTISSSINENSNVSDLVTTGYSINDGEVVNFTNYNEDIEGTVIYGTLSTTIRVYVLWNDAAETPTAALDVSLLFVQSID